VSVWSVRMSSIIPMALDKVIPLVLQLAATVLQQP
jgi:hypothetical protein